MSGAEKARARARAPARPWGLGFGVCGRAPRLRSGFAAEPEEMERGRATGPNGLRSRAGHVAIARVPLHALPIAAARPQPSPLGTAPTPTPTQAEAAREAKEKGNAAYKAGKIERAARMYTRVTDLVGDSSSGLDADKEGPEVKAQVGGACTSARGAGRAARLPDNKAGAPLSLNALFAPALFAICWLRLGWSCATGTARERARARAAPPLTRERRRRRPPRPRARQLKELRRSAWLNLAQVELKRGDFRAAQKNASKARPRVGRGGGPDREGGSQQCVFVWVHARIRACLPPCPCPPGPLRRPPSPPPHPTSPTPPTHPTLPTHPHPPPPGPGHRPGQR
jgi:hypothetical protein